MVYKLPSVRNVSYTLQNVFMNWGSDCCSKKSDWEGTSHILFTVVSRWQHVCTGYWYRSQRVWCAHGWHCAHIPVGKEDHVHLFFSGKGKFLLRHSKGCRTRTQYITVRGETVCSAQGMRCVIVTDCKQLVQCREVISGYCSHIVWSISVGACSTHSASIPPHIETGPASGCRQDRRSRW
jgi:hypothetical protein